MTPNEFLLNREALGLTPPQLAKELRVSTRHISYIENGDRKPSGVLIRCFELLIEKKDLIKNNWDEFLKRQAILAGAAKMAKEILKDFD